jgi:hypothetical protein
MGKPFGYLPQAEIGNKIPAKRLVNWMQLAQDFIYSVRDLFYYGDDSSGSITMKLMRLYRHSLVATRGVWIGN